MDKTRQWSLLAALAGVAILVGGWFLLVSPQRSKASEVRDQVTTQQQSNQSLQAQLTALMAQHRDVPQVQAQLAKLARQLPSNPSLPTLIRSLSNAADSAGVDLVSIQPSSPQVVPATVAAPAAPTTGTTSASGTPDSAAAAPAAPTPASLGTLAYVPLAIHVNGGYFEVEQFLSNLESLQRSFLVSDFTLAPGNPTGPASATVGSTSTTSEYTGFLDANITGRVFMVAPPVTTTPTVPTATAPSTTG